MISSDVEYSISRYAGIGHQPLPINPLKEFLKKGHFSRNKAVCPYVCWSIRRLVGNAVFFCLLGATNAVCTAFFDKLSDLIERKEQMKYVLRGLF